MSDSDESRARWEFVASILGTLFIVPMVYAWMKGPLPSIKIRQMETLLSETEMLLRSALEEGTITYDRYDKTLHPMMWQAKCHADGLRAKVYNIGSIWQELRHWFGGLSVEISKVMTTLYKVRGQIAHSSSRGRETLSQMGCTANPTLMIYSTKERISHVMLPVAPPHSAVMPSHVDDASREHRCARPDTVVPPDTADLSTRTRPSRDPGPLPPLPFPSAAVSEERHRFVLIPFGRKLPSPSLIDERARAPPLVLPTKSQRPSRLRAIFGFFHGSSNTNERDVLPRYRSAIPVPTPPPIPASDLEKFGDDALRIWTKEHVVAQVQLPV
ncbi:hypothetical protein C8Q76DRAFT_709048 [Earliella scabrosa]|nr:hypothetical protein C8Q76DRAFT_709048 [Earliella scabrosa]